MLDKLFWQSPNKLKWFEKGELSTSQGLKWMSRQKRIYYVFL